MSGNESWRWQGRQHHMWFGHGTKPVDGPDGTRPLPALADRIASLPFTVIAGLPQSQRFHAAARFEEDRAAIFIRAMHAWVRGHRLSPPAFAEHYFDGKPDSPGVAPLHKAAAALSDATGPADLRAASDHVAQAMMALGPDYFHRFVQDAAARAESRGPPLVPGRVAPAMPTLRPTSPSTPGGGGGGGTGLAGLILAVAAFLALLEEWRKSGAVPSDEQIAEAMERFGIGAGAGPEREAVAKALLAAERAQPGLIDQALKNDPAALAAVQAAVAAAAAAIKAALPPGQGIETYSDDERKLVAEMVAAGKTNVEIQAALDARRKADPGRTRDDLIRTRMKNTPWIPREVLEKIPLEWGVGEPNKDSDKGKIGWRWTNPRYSGDGVRIDEGNPNSSFPSQRPDHVVYRKGGTVRDSRGNPIVGPLKQNPDAHIPLTDYSRWKIWSQP